MPREGRSPFAKLERLAVRAKWRDLALPRIIILLVASLLLLGVPAAQASSDDDVAFEEVLVGDFGFFYDGPSDLVIRNQRQWCEFWEQAHGTRADPPSCDLSLVDFRH